MQVHRNRIPFLKQFRKQALGTRKREITADKVNKTTQVFTFAKKKSPKKKQIAEELKIVKIVLARYSIINCSRAQSVSKFISE
jgi:hypothetical protein